MVHYRLTRDNDDQFIKYVLKMAPPCVCTNDPLLREGTTENDELDTSSIFDNHIESYLAAVALNILAENIFRNYKERKARIEKKKESVQEKLASLLNDVRESWSKIIDVIDKRRDGFFLSFHYAKKLFSIYSNNEYVDNVVDLLAANYKSRNLIEDRVWRQKYLSDVQGSDQSLGFSSTGILNTPKADVLLEYRTLLRFLPEDTEEEALKLWLEVFAYDAQSFHTSGITRDLKHYEIAEMIYAQDDVIASWRKVRNTLDGAYHRISCDYYQDGSLSIRSHIEFLWNVNVCLLAYLGDIDEIAEAKALWELVWKDALQHVRRYTHYMDASPYQYVAALITTYFCTFVRDADDGDNSEAEVNGDAGDMSATEQSKEGSYINQLLPFFKEIDEMPILIVQTVDMLSRNRMSLRSIVNDEDYFLPIIRRANDLAYGRKEYEWVGKWTKEKRVAL